MRRVLRWSGIAAAGLLAGLLVLPYLLPFSSSGTATPQEVARASLGADPTFLSVGGIEVYVERATAGDREPAGGDPMVGDAAADDGAAPDAADDHAPPLIIVLHGFGASAATWREVLPELAAFGEVVAYDRPPFGFTERPTADGPVDPYGTDGQLDLLAAVIEAFRGDDPAREVVLLGHSAGGALAAEYARRSPDDVDALILVAPAVLTTGGPPRGVQGLLGFPPIERWGPWIARAAAGGGDRLLERSWHDPTRLTEAQRRRYAEPRRIDGWEHGLWRLVRAPSELTVSDDPSQLDLPVLLITGDDDRVVPTDDTRRLAGLLEGAQLEVLEATGHVPHEESPDALLTAVEAHWPLG